MPGDTARLDDFILDLEYIRDQFEKVIVENEFPFRDGAELTDMGELPREIEFRCHFLNERYSEHISFLEHVRETSDRLFELEHPTYGIIFGKIRSISVRRDEAVDAAEIDIVFVEELQGGISVVAPQVDVVSDNMEVAFANGQGQQMALCAADIIDSIGDGAQDIASRVLDPAESLVNEFIDISLDARNVLNVIDLSLSRAESVLSSITIPANEAVSIFEYPSTLPGRVVSVMCRCAARIAESLEDVAATPDAYIHNLAAALSATADTFSDTDFPLKMHFLTAASQILSVKCSKRYAEDEEKRDVLRGSERTVAFDVLGRYLNPPLQEEIMTVNQLEQSLATARSFIQAAIDGARSVSELKVMARELLDHVYKIKINRENIISKTYNNELPLHLVCLMENVSYEYAERMLSINPGIKNPSFVLGEVKVYVR